MFGLEEEEADEFGCNRPWLGAIMAPDNVQKPNRNQLKAPPIKLKLEWVHGFRASKCRNGLSYLQDGSLGYFNAGVGITYNPSRREQNHFTLHKDDITCIAFCPKGTDVATAENGKTPSCFIWDSVTMQKKFELKRNGIIRNI